jgi:aspartate/methionine/tyrosine aminotransferase
MIPIPQYPIYSATLALVGGVLVPYNLSEEDGWSAKLEALETSLTEARAKGTVVKSFVLINPGNPTGQVLSKESIMDIVKFCAKHNLVLLADEVYQENVYVNKPFVSCKLAASEAGVLDKLEVSGVVFVWIILMTCN